MRIFPSRYRFKLYEALRTASTIGQLSPLSKARPPTTAYRLPYAALHLARDYARPHLTAMITVTSEWVALRAAAITSRGPSTLAGPATDTMRPTHATIKSPGWQRTSGLDP